MTPNDALMEVKKKKANDETLFVVSFSYDKQFVLPHKAALQLIDALAQAEFYTGRYGDESIRAPKEDDFGFAPFSREKYYDIKAANLLRVPYTEFIKQIKENP